MTSKKKKITIIIGSILVLLVIIRIILPHVVLKLVNDRLANMDGYYGHVMDIDIALIRGAYQIDSIYLNKVDSVTNDQTEFFSASLIDLSVEWRSLFKGSIVGEVKMEKPIVTFVKDKVEPESVRNDSSSFKNLIDDLMPLQINRIELNQGIIKYRDETSNPKVDISMTNANILALNLRNSYDSTSVLPATLKASANIYQGQFTVDAKLNPLADEPTFDLNAELKNTNLVELNEFFQAYAKVDVNKGSFGLYTEVAAKEGKFKGYVKPVIKDLDILGKEDRNDNIFRKMWEGLAGVVGEVFENQSEDQVATKIPFEGSLANPDTNTWEALAQILQNAFIQALQPSIDQEINLQAVDQAEPEKETLIQKIFGKKDKDDQEK